MTDESRQLSRNLSVREPPARVRSRARWRITLSGGVLGGLLVVAGVRGVWLGVWPGDRLLELVVNSRCEREEIHGDRGQILDRNMRPLAMSVPAHRLVFDPQAFRDLGGRSRERARSALEHLAELLKVEDAQLHDLLAAPGRYKVVRKMVPPAVEKRVHALSREHHWLRCDPDTRRLYPEGDLAAQVLGFVNHTGVGATEGVVGLEVQHHEALAGESLVGLDKFGMESAFDRRKPEAVAGKHVVVTLDAALQRVSEQALDHALDVSDAKAATAVLLDVNTGHILAMANAPRFNPNRRDEDVTRYERNRAIADAIEPGSVFKPFTLAAALEEGVVSLNERIETTSPYRLYDRNIHDDHPHPAVTPYEMVKFSSNIGAAKIAGRLYKKGRTTLVDYLQSFGLGPRTGILLPGEASGKVTRGTKGPGPVENATTSYGQGVTATTLQLAVATATVASGGIRRRPMLHWMTRRTLNDQQDDRDVRSPDPGVRVMSEQTAQHVQRAMAMVLEEGGTGTAARVPGFDAGGKTGTAQKANPDGPGYSKTLRIASFVGFAPLERPQVAMAIVVDEPRYGMHYGGQVAGPVFSTVVEAALLDRGLQPALDPASSDPDAAPADPPPVILSPITLLGEPEGWVLPDFKHRSIRDVLASLQGLGLDVQIKGGGRLVSQAPPPGARVTSGDAVSLVFQP